MKKYIVKNKATGQLIGEYDTKKKAHWVLISHVRRENKLIGLNGNDEFVDIFDFEIVEEMREINSYERAKEYLGLDGDTIDIVSIADKRYQRACSAFSKLLTIAEAWNKEDGFEVDFSNRSQFKYYPWFKYNEDAKQFVCRDSTCWNVSPVLSHFFFFASHERAVEFGKKFENLFNELFG